MKTKRILILVISLIVLIGATLSVTGCEFLEDLLACKHQWAEATCTSAKTCTICGATEGKELGHTVVVDDAVEATCSTPGLTAGSHCQVCGEAIVEQKTISPLGHEHTPTITEPTCSEWGYTTWTCHCGHSYVDNRVEPVEHAYGEWKIYAAPTADSEGSERRYCVNCDHYEERALDKIEHSMGDWVVTKAPTCTEVGEQRRDCANCDYFETKPIDVIDHTYEADVIAPTCEEQGYTLHTCICGDSYKDNYVAATGHSWDEGTVTTAPGCESEGVLTKSCANECGKTTTESIPAIGHTHKAEVTAPTCEDQGYTTYTCACGHSYKDNYVAATGHSWDEGTVTTAPGCESEGVLTKSCNNECGKTTTESIPAKGHDYKSEVTAPTCEERGYTTYTCACGHSYQGDYVAETGHTYSKEVTAPTCTEKGYTTYTCACGHSYVGDYVDTIEHSYTTVVTAPTCTTEGFTTYTCSACEHTYVGDKVNPLGHDYSDWEEMDGVESGKETHIRHCSRCDAYETSPHDYTEVVTAPTCTEQGYTTYTCDCGYEKIDNYVASLGHKYGEWYTTEESTCTEKGEKQRDCERCDNYETGEVPAKGHSYEATVTAPTCEERGYTTYTCVCGNSYKDNYVAATGHSWDEGTVTTVPECESDGVLTKSCTNECGKTTTESIPATGHTHKAEVTAPTCEDQGYTTYTCACGDSYVDNYVAATGHSWDEGTVTTVPECESDGVLTKSCTNECGKTTTESIPATGHTHKAEVTAPTCEDQGYTTYTCACGDSYVDNYTAATGHTYSKQVTVPTCTEGGYTTYTCECGHSYVGDRTSALGHVGGEATCTSGPICSVCGTEYGSANGHDMIDASCNEPAQCKNCDHTEGEALGHIGGAATCTALAVCDRCGESYGGLLDHTMVEAGCTSPAHCEKCEYTEGEALGHIGGAATCTALAVCDRCGESYGKLLAHDYSVANNSTLYLEYPASCEAPASYFYSCACGEKGSETYTVGAALGHHVVTTANANGTHTNACTRCDESEVENCSGGAATCTSAAICEKCREYYGEALGHSYNDGVVTAPDCVNAGNTTYTCITCNATKIETIPATGHKYDAKVTDPTCTTKGYTIHTCSCGHSYVDSYVDAKGHSMSGWVEIVAPTCTKVGEERNDCSVCDYYETKEVSALGHNHVTEVTAPTCTEKGYTTYKCSCGDKYVADYKDALGHTYSEKVTAPTCTEKGYTTYTCSCGDTYDGAYEDALGHAWDDGKVTIAPTCTKAGVMTYACHCGETKTTVIPATGHNYNEVVTAPTCTEKGYTTYTCKNENCGHNYVANYVDTIDHTYSEKVTAPTCTEEGYTTYTCSCGHSYKDNEVNATGHSWDNGKVTTAPTCTKAGVMTYACHCGETKTASVPATDHNYNETVTAPTCTTKGYTTYTCKNENCGHSYVKDYVDALNHNYDETVTAPTCTSKGYTTYTCKVENCGHSYIADYVDEIEHTYGNNEITKHPTCITTGVETETCECGAKKTTVIPETGHSYEKKITAPTCTTKGYTTYTCSCGDKYVADYENALGHTYSENVTDPTCTEQGYTTYTCSCGDTYVGAYKDALGHTWDNGKVTVAPTCTKTGVMTYTCHCGEKETEEIEALGHSHEAKEVVLPTCTEKGYTTYECSCGDKYVADYKDALNHNYKEVVTAPTCTTKGYTTYTCENCVHSYVGNYVNEKEHAFGNKEVTDPTCTKAGVEVETCECGAQKTTVIPATGHTHKAEVTAPTCTAKGYTTYTCSCGDTYKADYVDEKGHEYSASVTAPTCTAGGYTTYTCADCNDSYVSDATSAPGHSWDIKKPTCTGDQVCTVCGEKVEALGHSVVLASTDEATCTSAQINHYKCANCDYGYDEIVGSPIAHDLSGVSATLTLKAGETCVYIEHYECNSCHGDVVGKEVTKHEKYTAEITIPATCQTEGVKTLTCAACRETKNETIPVDTTLGHKWDEGVLEGTNRTYTCQNDGCGQTKSVYDASGETSTTVDSGALKDELALKDANLDFSGIDNDIQGNVTIGAGTLTDEDKNNLQISKEALGQVGDNPIYNFTMEDSNGSAITKFNGGKVTITIPYVLEEDEDVDSIAIWYIEGETLVSIPATYNNGYVTFETDHFSYYTVTKLTPTQRCEVYGHNFKETVVDATCTEAGYTLNYCIRCGYSEKSYADDAKPLGHDYKFVIIKATCTADGKTVYTCSECNGSYEEIIPATGHSYDSGVITKAAGCTTEGIKTYTCTSCSSHSRTEVIAPTGHSYDNGVVTNAKCTEKGYTTYTCGTCNHSYKDNYTNPTGHSYNTSVTAPTCTEKGYTTYTCSCGDTYVGAYKDSLGHTWDNGKVTTDPTCTKTGVTTYTCHCGEIKTAVAPATGHNYDEVVTAPTCTSKGYTTYTCKVENCNHSYVADYVDALDHTYGEEVTDPTCTEKGYTTYTCSCGDTYVGAYKDSLGHTWDNGKVTTDPTCTKTGVTTYTCHCGEIKTAVAPATGHNYDEVVTAPTCTSKGYTTYTCKVEGCRHSYVGNYVDTIDHTYSEKVTAPTCTEKGYTTHTCSCGHSYKDNEVNATGHTWDNGNVTIAPTCTKTGVMTYTCHCGETKTTVISATGHNYSEVVTTPTCTSKGYTTYTCKVEGCGHSYVANYVDTIDHTYSEKVTAPTCTEKGYTTHTCSCGHSYVDSEVDAKGHTMSGWAETVAPTCTKAGEERNSCSECDYYETNELSALGHNYVPVVTAPTCTAKGYTTYTCQAGNCGHSYITDYVNALNHNYVAEVTAPTCTSKGYTTYTCKVENCGHSYIADYVNENEHIFGNETVTKAPTCTSKGVMMYTCSCGETKTEEIKELGHSHVAVVTAPTCTTKGYTTYTCQAENCGHSYVENYVDALDHDYVAEVTAPTCTEKGYTTYTCKRDECGSSYISDYVDANGHDYSSLVTVPTCTDQGYTTYTCSCGHTYIGNYENAKGHTYVETVIAPTCEAAGYTISTCSCGDAYTSNFVAATGHDYEGTWTWSDDYSYATLSVKCNNSGCKYNDTPYTKTVDSSVTSFESTCEVAGRDEYYVYHEFGGESFSELIKIPKATGKHNYHEDYQYNKETHWFKCSGCSGNSGKIPHEFDEGTVTKTPTCVSVGEITYKCECGYTKTEEIPQNESHTPGSEIYHDETGHWYVCIRCHEERDLEAHAWGEGKVTAQATCSSVGAMTYRCFCGEVKIEEIPVNDNHNYSKTLSYNEAGHWSECTLCGDISAVAEHSFNEWKVVTPATCTATGTKQHKCSCGYVETAEIPVIEHVNITKSDETNHWNECRVCGEKSDVADHSHETVVEAKLPTCAEEGYEIRSCACGHTTRIVLEKTNNHAELVTKYDDNAHWLECTLCSGIVNEEAHNHVEVLERVESTCRDAGYEIRTCECGHETTVELPLSNEHADREYRFNEESHWLECVLCGNVSDVADHSHETVVEAKLPTCAEEGYEIRSCACGHTTRIVLEKTNNHAELVTKYDDNAHWLECTLCSGIVNEEAHNHVEVLERVESTCRDAGYEIRSCECGHETTVELPLSDEHADREYRFNEESHWLECVLCGDRSEYVNHSYDLDREIVEAPNCTEEGLAHVFCVCGSYVEESIEPNGEHSYKDGVCEHCGSIDENACDHELVESYLAFKDLGYCGGGLTYYACECGEYIEYCADLNIVCDVEYTKEIQGIDENGNVYLEAEMVCRDCGFHAYAYVVQTFANCEYRYDYIFVLYDSNGDILLDIEFVDAYEYHEAEIADVVGIADKTCGTEIYIYKCLDCGAVTSMVDLEEKCNFEISDFEYTLDENGEPIAVKQVATCPDCGLVVTTIFAVEYITPCDYTESASYMFAINDEIVFEFSTSSRGGGHEFEFKYELLGEHCSEGVIVTATCIKCGETYTDMSYDHNSIQWHEFNTAEYGICEGYGFVEVCDICNEAVSISVHYTNCWFERISVDESGIVIERCSICGVERHSATLYSDKDEYCNFVVTYVDVFYIDGELVLDATHVEHHQTHNEQYIYELLGETCEDGYVIYVTCSDCGNNYRYTSYEHRTHSEYFDLQELGFCGGTAANEICDVCHKHVRTDIHEMDCAFELISYDEETNVSYHRCDGCGIELYVSRIDSEKNEWCSYEAIITYRYYKDGKLVIETSYVDYFTEHNYEVTYDFFGESCEDGYVVRFYCHDCGNTFDDTRYNHDVREEHFDLKELGLCEGYGYKEICSVCEEVVRVAFNAMYCSFELVSVDGNTEYARCNACGGERHIISTLVSKDENCFTYYETVELYYNVNGELVLQRDGYAYIYSHDYQQSIELNGESCNDGYRIVYTCTSCGDSYDYVKYGHNTVSEDIDLSHYDICSGIAHKEVCTICDKVVNSWIEDNCNWISNGSVVSPVENQAYIVKMYVATSGSIVYLDGGIDRRYLSTTEDITKAVYVYAEECEDGYYAFYILVDGERQYIILGIDDSGKNALYYSSSEITYFSYRADINAWVTVYDNLEYFIGSYKTYTNVGAYNIRYITSENTGVEQFPIEIIKDGEISDGMWTCSTCGAEKQASDTVNWIDSCRYEVIEKIEYYMNGSLVFETSNSSIFEEHNYKDISFDLDGESCSDGLNIVYACICGDSYSEHTTEHFIIPIYTADFENSNSCKHHYVNLTGCPCGQELGELDFDMEGLLPIEDYGDNYYSGGYVCETCGYSLVMTYIVDQEGCTYYETAILKVTIDGRVDYEYSTSYSYNQHNNVVTYIPAESGRFIISNRCSECGVGTDTEFETVTIVYNDVLGYYYYDLYFTPEVSGAYYIYSACSVEAEVQLYELLEDGSLNYMGGYDVRHWNNFGHKSELVAGQTYVYRIYSNDANRNTEIPYVLAMVDDNYDPYHTEFYGYNCYPENYVACRDNSYHVVICGCGCGYVGSIQISSPEEPHHYENGFCQNCGAECAHEADHLEYISLADFGFCGGILMYYTCDCGLVTETNPNEPLIHISCSNAIPMDREGVDENGNPWLISSAECLDCGLYLEVYIAMEETKCYQMAYGTYTLYTSNGGEVIVSYPFNIKEGIHSDLEVIGLNLGDKVCGGDFNLVVCKTCGEVIDITEPTLHCNLIDEEIGYVYTDKGVEYVARAYCPDCGIEIKVIQYQYANNCSTTVGIRYEVYTGGELVYELDVVYEHERQHNFSYYYEYLGDSCSDGAMVYIACYGCDFHAEYLAYGHQELTYTYINASTFGFCSGGEAYAEICNRCGEIIKVEDLNLYNCNFEYMGVDSETGAEIYQCTSCGAIKHYVFSESEKDENCIIQRVVINKYYLNGELVIDLSYEHTSQQHDIEISYELIGGSCEDGYYIYETCKDCGIVESRISYGHPGLYEYLMWSDLGVQCGGWLERNVCQLCGHIDYAYGHPYCNMQYVGYDEATGAEMYQCYNCDTVRLMREPTVTFEGCATVYRSAIEYYVDGILVATVIEERREEYHNSYYELERMYGESCTDGVIIIERCYNCDVYYRHHITDHAPVIFTNIDMENKGCGKHYFAMVECPCGQLATFDTNYDCIELDPNSTEEDMSLVCADCDFRIRVCSYDEVNGCLVTTYGTLTLTIDGEIVYTYSAVYEEIKHNYVSTYTPKEDGSFIISNVCSGCGAGSVVETEAVVLEKHDREYYYDLYFTPETSGEYLIFGVTNEDTCLELYMLDEHGSLIYIDSNDGRYSADFYLDYYLEAGVTYVYRIKYWESYRPGTINYILTTDHNIISCSHMTRYYSFLIDGVSCENGIVGYEMCDCGYVRNVGVSYEHSGEREVGREELSNYGACGGYISYMVCACGEHESVQINYYCSTSYSEEYYEIDGIIYNVQKNTCYDCGLVRTRISYSAANENCEYCYYEITTVTIGGYELFRTENVTVQGIKHTYVDSFVKDDDSFTITRACQYCGDCIEVEVGSGYTQYDQSTGNYHYDLYFTPEESGNYLIYQATHNYNTLLDLYRVLEDGSLELVASYAESYSFFDLTCYLESGVTYVYRMSTYHNYNNAQISYVITNDESTINCINHYTDGTIYVLADGFDSCDDGYVSFQMCDCGRILGYLYSISHDTYYKDNIYLGQYGACDGYINFYECLCGERTHYEVNAWCLKEQLDTFYVDEDGVYHYVTIHSCSTCGLVYTYEYFDKAEGCYTYRYYDITVSIGGTEVFANSYSAVIGTDHNCVVTEFILNGETCDDGVTAVMTCTDCGYSYTTYYTGHNSQIIENYDFTEYGACYGYYRVYSCACGYSHGINQYYCSHTRVSTETYVDANGIEHTVQVYACSTCGLTRTRDYYYQVEECYTYRIDNNTFSMNGEEICSYIEKSIYSTHHDYVYTYEFADENNRNCEAGVTVYYVCEDCGVSGSDYLTHHNGYRVYEADLEALGCCSNHEFYYSVCPCGESYGYSYTKGTIHDGATDTYYCYNNCGYTVVRSQEIVVDGCMEYHVTTITLRVNGVDIYSFNYTVDRAIHDFAILATLNSDDSYTVNMTCQRCGECVSASSGSTISETVILENHNGEYYYDYQFIPTENGRYVITSNTSGDTYVTLYKVVNGEYYNLTSNDDGANNGNFKLSYNLVAGETYVYRIRFYNSETSGSISFTFGTTNETDGDPACESHITKTVNVLAYNANSCEDGTFRISMCGCGRITNIVISRTHNIELSERIDYCDSGYVNVYKCLCGDQGYMSRSGCIHGTNSNSSNYVDEDGIRWYVDSYYAPDYCGSGMRMDRKYYYTYDAVTCTKTIHYVETLALGDTLVAITQRSVVETWHDCEVSYELLGTSCDDGVIITSQCRNCDYSHTSTTSGHTSFEIERFYSNDFGAECGGYVVITGCACGYTRNVSVEYADCEFWHNGTNNWISGALNNYQETADGGHSFYTYSYVYTCAVTDPTQCTFVVRYSNYWLKNSDCSATYYLTVQLGYNEADGTCAKEVTYALRSETYHNYEYSYVYENDRNGSVYICSDCGSYYSCFNYYNENGNHIKNEYIYVNTLDDGRAKYRENTWEYLGENFNDYLGNPQTEYYHKMIYADGREYWSREEYTYEAIEAAFGDSSYSETIHYTDSNGATHYREYGYTIYKGYPFYVYELSTEQNGYWDRYDYTYSFENGCERTYIYTNSNGTVSTGGPSSAHPTYYWNHTIKAPTCTQYGIEGRWCPVCEHSWDEYSVVPTAHNWVRLNSGIYYCYDCGLQNINGATGDMVMEDLTSKYGNGEAYVIGYWNINNIQFTPYVMIYLHEPMIVDGFEEYGFLLWMMTDDQFHFVDDEFVGMYVSISDIEDAVAWLCDMYGIVLTPDMYDVSISFVPDGADDNFDYAITFANLSGSEDIDYVIHNSEFIVEYVASGEKVEFTICPEFSGYWDIEAWTSRWGTLYIYNSDGGMMHGTGAGHHTSYIYFAANETYTVEFTMGSGYEASYVAFSFNQVIHDYPTTFYYYTDSWSNVNIYLWNWDVENDTRQYTSWPGYAMTPVEGMDGWYSITVDCNIERDLYLIFNNGYQQTANLTYDGNAWWVWETSYETLEEAQNSNVSTPKMEYYLRGSMNGWGLDDVLVYDNEGNASIEAYLYVGDEFKIANSSWAHEFNYGYVEGNECFTGTYSGGNIIVAVEGNYKITVTNDNQLIVELVAN